jgi:hypothetical protein
MTHRVEIPRDGLVGLAVAVVVAAALLAGAWLGGTGAEVTIVVPPLEATATEIPAPSATASPGVAVVPEPARQDRVAALAVSDGFPPVESVIEHYFGPLGEVSTALEVYGCETPDGSDWVGDAGELGPFQLHPRGAGERFLNAGWNLMDARENVIAAALVVAAEGWGPWSACLP